MPRPSAGSRLGSFLVVTVVHDPEDARIRHRQLRAMREAGHAVTFAAPYAAYGRAVPEGVRGVDLPRAWGRSRARSLAAAARLLRREGPRHDLVLLHDLELLLAAAAAWPALRRTAVVWDVHEDTAAALRMKGWVPPPARGALPGAVLALERWAERHLRLVLAEESYAARFRRRHPVVPNSVLVAAEEPPPPGRDRVVYLGRITRARGGLDLITLGRALRPDVTLELVGPADPDVRGAVEAAARAGDVVWRGFVPNAEALTRLPGALAGLSLLHDEPNYAHSRPTKLMEYMAAGVPVVTTPNPVSAELVGRYRCGLVVPFGNPGAAADAVRRLRDDEPLRRAAGDAGRRAAVAELDWARDGARFVAQLEQWAARGR